jgi:hypothetical protein
MPTNGPYAVGNGGVEGADAYTVPADGEEEVVIAEEPLVPLQPAVWSGPPDVSDVDATAASLTWSPATWRLPEHDSRQAELQQLCSYTLDYKLQLQHVQVASKDAPWEEIREQVKAQLVDKAWWTVDTCIPFQSRVSNGNQ